MNFLINKKPGDGSVTNLKSALEKNSGAQIVLEIVGDDFDPSFFTKLEQQVKTQPDVPINLVIDLFQASHPEKWLKPVGEVMINRKMGEITLPEKTAMITIIRDDPSVQLPAYLNARFFHIQGSEVGKLNLSGLIDDLRAPAVPESVMDRFTHVEIEPSH